MDHERQQNQHVVRLRHSYASIIQAIIAANGEWHAVDPQSISGLSKATKQSRLWQAGVERGLKMQTSFQPDGLLYARLLPEGSQQ
jgi:hypothetical protein